MTNSNYTKDEAYKIFASHTKSNTPNLDFEGTCCWARVVSVYDGDTITAIMEVMPGQFRRVKLRLASIDTSEIRGGTNLAIAARNRLIELISGVQLNKNDDLPRKVLDKIFDNNVCLTWMMCHGNDKYGRILVDVYERMPIDEIKTMSFNQVLVKEGLAYEYNGGTKKYI